MKTRSTILLVLATTFGGLAFDGKAEAQAFGGYGYGISGYGYPRYSNANGYVYRNRLGYFPRQPRYGPVPMTYNNINGLGGMIKQTVIVPRRIFRYRRYR